MSMDLQGLRHRDGDLNPLICSSALLHCSPAPPPNPGRVLPEQGFLKPHLNRKARRRVDEKVSTRYQRRYGLEVDLQNALFARLVKK